MNVEHECKILPEHFNNILAGLKSFEVRKDDREPPYMAGDSLLLREWDEGIYTGRWIKADIPLVLRGEYCKPGYCTMSIVPISAGGCRFTRFQAIKALSCADDLALLLSEKGFCPFAHEKGQGACEKTCRNCVLDWLMEEDAEH